MEWSVKLGKCAGCNKEMRVLASRYKKIEENRCLNSAE